LCATSAALTARRCSPPPESNGDGSQLDHSCNLMSIGELMAVLALVAGILILAGR
jgi:hypothetical protein